VPAWREIDVGGGGAAAPLPQISVVIPFHDSRGDPDHLIGWTRDQSLESRLFEVIAAIDGSLGPKLELELRRHLRPQDRLIAVNTHEPFSLYAAGADAAKGSLLFFTEDHCVAEAGCLAAVKRHLETTEDPGASVRWGHINHNDVGRMEELLSHVDAKQWSRPDHWNKVRIRGFAVRREAYLDAGGFDWRYGNFSESVLAARLHSRGHRIGHVSDSGVLHVNTEALHEIEEHVWEYSWKECVFCDEHDLAFCETYFSASTVLAKDILVPPALAHWMARALLKTVVRDRTLIGHGNSSLWGALVSVARLACGSLELPLRRLLAWPRVWSARARYYFWRFDEAKRFQAFSDFWLRVVDAARIVYAGKHRPQAANRGTLHGIDPAEFLIQGAPGCLGMECFKGRTFRWTWPVAVIPLRLPVGKYELIIDTGRLRGADLSFPMGLFWNRRLIPRNHVRCKKGLVSITVARRLCLEGPTQELTIAVAPAVRLGAERRWLGLPICSLQVLRRNETPC